MSVQSRLLAIFDPGTVRALSGHGHRVYLKPRGQSDDFAEPEMQCSGSKAKSLDPSQLHLGGSAQAIREQRFTE